MPGEGGSNVQFLAAAAGSMTPWRASSSTLRQQSGVRKSTVACSVKQLGAAREEASVMPTSADGKAGSGAPGDGGWQVSGLDQGLKDGAHAVYEVVEHVTAHQTRAVRATAGTCDAGNPWIDRAVGDSWA
jgi:hypothetical protein